MNFESYIWYHWQFRWKDAYFMYFLFCRFVHGTLYCGRFEQSAMKPLVNPSKRLETSGYCLLLDINPVPIYITSVLLAGYLLLVQTSLICKWRNERVLEFLKLILLLQGFFIWVLSIEPIWVDTPVECQFW